MELPPCLMLHSSISTPRPEVFFPGLIGTIEDVWLAARQPDIMSLIRAQCFLDQHPLLWGCLFVYHVFPDPPARLVGGVDK